MQQGHPRRKQLDRARHEIKMRNRRKRKEAIDVLCDVYRAIGQTVKEISKGFQEAFRKYGSGVTFGTKGVTFGTKIDSGLTSIEM